MPSPARLFKRFPTVGTNGHLDLSLSCRESEDPLKTHTGYDQGPEIHGRPRRMSLLVGEAQLVGSMGRWSVGVGRSHPVTMRRPSFKTLSMKIM